jgi:NTP pyrophosphatase (non-canonical NTP hydrolase)
MIFKKKTVDYIKTLTKQDKKNLSQKALKVSEEVGELARTILPFESAHGTTHRFVDKEAILEEVIDTMLTSISIAYDIGASDTDIEDMLNRKITKWADLQQREDKMKETVPYEIHITVKNADKERFITLCKKLEVKPIILDLQKTDGKTAFEDVMTSSKHFGNNSSAYIEMERIASHLAYNHFNVVRKKIETVPWHPAAPSETHDNPLMPPNCYFETHIGVTVKDNTVPILRNIAKLNDAHLSRNAFKTNPDGSYVLMVTYRRYSGTFESFSKVAAFIRNEIKTNNFKINNVVTEFSVYDTKVSHDKSWLIKNEKIRD